MSSSDPAEGPEGARSAEPTAGSPRVPDGPGSSLLDTLRVGIVMLDGRGTVTLWSPKTEDILGWPAAEVIGRDIEEFIEGGAEERREVLVRTHGWRGMMYVRHREGHLVEVEGRASLLRDTDGNPFVLANIVEASRLRAVEHDLAALDALFASSPLGIALFDTEKRFVRFNEALVRLNRSAGEQMLGRTVADVLPAGMADEILRVQSTVLETGRSVVDMVTSAPDGKGARSVSYSRLTDPCGEVLGVSCTVMDITERLEALNKVEAARGRLALLDEVGVALGDLLDVRAVAQALASALVPQFADYAVVQLRGEVVRGGDLPSPVIPTGTPVHQAGVAARYSGERVDRLLRIGAETVFRPGSFLGRVLASGEALLAASPKDIRGAARTGDPRVDALLDLGIHSLLAVPLRARGTVLGLLLVSRSGERESYDRDDLALGLELADRAGTSLDNARLYAREREGALMLQRSLLPQHIPEPPGVQVASRYVPGASGTEVGGDWFDVIALPGGRVAFVVGDVMGHGLHSAVTMGRLRTAVRTLAGLDLRPDELLARVSDLGDDLSPAGDPLMATCLYAVYEPAPTAAGDRRGLLTLARAGHVPPLLVVREPSDDGGPEVCRTRTLDLPPGMPLGVGPQTAGPGGFEAVELEVDEGSVLVLYTDGLVELRGEDISEGIERLRSLLSGPCPGEARRTACGGIQETCNAMIASLRRSGQEPASGETPMTEDDVALLVARLGGLPPGTAASWSFDTGSYAVRRAREAVRATLASWQLHAVQDTAELLVSELVTNALRYAHGPIGVRLVRDVPRPSGAGVSVLTVEVSDPLHEPPRERAVSTEQEGGRGIQLVASGSHRWGTRHGPSGKTVWFELVLP